MSSVLIAFIVLLAAAVLVSVLFAAYNFFHVKKLKSGDEKMNQIADAIKEGSQAFIAHEYKIIIIAAAAVAVLIGLLLDYMSAIAFVIGVTLSGLAGVIGMRMATLANVRVANTAKEQKHIGKTLKVALRGGSVMGLCVAGFALLGLLLCFLIFGKGAGLALPENITNVPNGLVGLEYVPITMIFSSYALGCSIVALFARIGGGIYTKAADMGADLVGKTEAHIPEDDARNPATIADNVGDNVGDVAGLGSDLLESFVGSIISAVVLAAYMFITHITIDGATRLSSEFIEKLMLYPMTFAGLGTIACVIGIFYVLMKKPSNKPHRELNIALWASAFLVVAGAAVMSWLFFKDVPKDQLEAIGFKAGTISPWIGAAIGIICGILIGIFAELYTSFSHKPTKKVGEISKEGTALVITKGLALGMKSCFLPVIVLSVSVVGAFMVSGIYGVTMAAVGMLSFVASTVSVDSYGPIADNAGGISEMSGLGGDVREITDKLDSVGNTTAAIGKGFAIGSGALAALSLLISFVYSYDLVNLQLINGKIDLAILNIINPLTLVGAFVGGALPFFFSGMLIDAVAKSAQHMVNEVRRQFKENPGILTGETRPDYKKCIKISAAGAIKEMKLPVAIALGVPIICGFVFGTKMVGGILIGSTISAIMLAIFTANAGGAWDNAKKAIEQGEVEGAAKHTPAHESAIIGDTVGDPLKDTVGPSLDILIKIMATVSLIAGAIFNQFNLFSALNIAI